MDLKLEYHFNIITFKIIRIFIVFLLNLTNLVGLSIVILSCLYRDVNIILCNGIL